MTSAPPKASADHRGHDLRSQSASNHIARWDLDKTYLRTDFDTVRELVRTALERADEKKSHPGAAVLLRELQAGGTEIHVLSGSPEQMRRKLEEKLRLDGIQFRSLTLKPNLQNLMRLRLRSIRGQLGYKLPSLLRMRSESDRESGNGNGSMVRRETLVGDDAEADGFIYSIYADLCSGAIGEAVMIDVMRRDRCHPDEIEDAIVALRNIERRPVVERILIHLDRQTPPSDFNVFGALLRPFYNYFQAALILNEDGRLSADAVLRVGTDMVLQHRFDGDALVRSYLDLARRGHLVGSTIDALVDALERWPGPQTRRGAVFGVDEVQALGRRADELRATTSGKPAVPDDSAPLAAKAPDYAAMVDRHNRRRSK